MTATAHPAASEVLAALVGVYVELTTCNGGRVSGTVAHVGAEQVGLASPFLRDGHAAVALDRVRFVRAGREHLHRAGYATELGDAYGGAYGYGAAPVRGGDATVAVA